MKISVLFRNAILVVLVMTASIAKGEEAEKKAENTNGKKSQNISHVVLTDEKSEMIQNQSLASENLIIFHKANILTVSFINKDQKKAVFKIYGKDGSTLYRTSPVKSIVVHERIATNKLPEGMYKASLKVGDEEFAKAIYVMR